MQLHSLQEPQELMVWKSQMNFGPFGDSRTRRRSRNLFKLTAVFQCRFHYCPGRDLLNTECLIVNCEWHIDVFSPNCVERNFGGTFSGKLNGCRGFTGLWIVWIKVPTFEAIARSIYNFYNFAFFVNASIITAIRNVFTIVSRRTFDKELPSS